MSNFCSRLIYEPTPEKLAKLPKLYETEKIPLKDKPIYIHFFVGDCDWFISEYDGEDLSLAMPSSGILHSQNGDTSHSRS
jgi:hypothetical protein